MKLISSTPRITSFWKIHGGTANRRPGEASQIRPSFFYPTRFCLRCGAKECAILNRHDPRFSLPSLGWAFGLEALGQAVSHSGVQNGNSGLVRELAYDNLGDRRVIGRTGFPSFPGPDEPDAPVGIPMPLRRQCP
jgi:hypothetical protein